MTPCMWASKILPQTPTVSFADSAVVCGVYANTLTNNPGITKSCPLNETTSNDANPAPSSTISTTQIPPVCGSGGISTASFFNLDRHVTIGPDVHLSDEQLDRSKKGRFVILGHHMVWSNLHPEDYKKILADIISMSPRDRAILRESIWWPHMLDESVAFIFLIATSSGTSEWKDSDWDTLKSRLDNYLSATKGWCRTRNPHSSSIKSHNDRRRFIQKCIRRAAQEQLPQELSDMCQLVLQSTVQLNQRNPNRKNGREIEMMLREHPESIGLQKMLHTANSYCWNNDRPEQDICLNYIGWCAAQPNVLDESYLAICWATIARQESAHLALIQQKIDKLDAKFCPNLCLILEAIQVASDLSARRNILQPLAFSVATTNATYLEVPNWSNLEHVITRIQGNIWTRAAAMSRLSREDAKDFINLIRRASYEEFKYLKVLVKSLDKASIGFRIFRQAINMRECGQSFYTDRRWKRLHFCSDAEFSRNNETFVKISLKFGRNQQREKFLLDCVAETTHERLDTTVVEMCFLIIKNCPECGVNNNLRTVIRDASASSNWHKGISDALIYYTMNPQTRTYGCANTHLEYPEILQSIVGFGPTLRSPMETVTDFISWCGSQTTELPESYLDMCWVVLPFLTLSHHERIYRHLTSLEKSEQPNTHAHVILQAVLLSHRNLTRWEYSNAVTPRTTVTAIHSSPLASSSLNPAAPAWCPAQSELDPTAPEWYPTKKFAY